MILLAALLAVLQGAPAAEPGDVVACVRRTFPPSDLARLQAQMLGELETGEKHPDTPALVRALTAAAAGCQPGGDKPADARAGRFVVATIAAEAMRARLAAAGADVDRLDAAIVAATPEVRAAFLAKSFATPGVGAFSRGVIAASGLPSNDQALRRLLGAYTLNMLRIVERGGA